MTNIITKGHKKFSVRVLRHTVCTTRHLQNKALQLRIKSRSDSTTVQESCTLLDTQSQQIMYKRRQVQLPTVFSQENTHLTEYHGIHTDK